MTDHQPAIVVMGFNRPKSLKRLLRQVALANFPTKAEITLVISLDRCEDVRLANAVAEVAAQFEWPHGIKKVRRLDRHLGLREHVLMCVDLATDYGSVIVLEDDLGVAPEFYRWAAAAADFSDRHADVAGVALYSPTFNESNQLRFDPLFDGADNFYLQRTCSWGQLFTANQWKSFRGWFDQNQKLDRHSGLPQDILSWPASSWKKHHIAYLLDADKTFLYPRCSLTTNYGDLGTHFDRPGLRYQVPLAFGEMPPRFVGPQDSIAQYDVFFEISPAVLRRRCNALEEYRFAVDLSGDRHLDGDLPEYILTTRPGGLAVKSWSNQLKPAEVNLLLDEPGGEIRLVKTKEIHGLNSGSVASEHRFEVFAMEYGAKTAIWFALRKLMRRLGGR